MGWVDTAGWSWPGARLLSKPTSVRACQAAYPCVVKQPGRIPPWSSPRSLPETDAYPFDVRRARAGSFDE